MRKNWKRILAATLAACMIFCDSSLVYAAESQPIVEASETEVETTEIGDETTLPEATEEEVVTEESTEEVEDVEPVEETEQEEILPEEVPVEEEEVVEIKAVTEVSSVAQMNSATGNTVLAPWEKVTVSGSDTRYYKDFDFTVTESGKYYLYVQGKADLSIGYIQAYKSDGVNIDSSQQPEMCYDLDVGATSVEDIVRGYVLESGTKYKFNIQGNVNTGDEATFWIAKIDVEPTKLVADSNTEAVKPEELKIYKITEDHLQTGIVKWTGESEKIDFRVYAGASVSWQRSFSNSNRTEGDVALLIPENQTYYIVIKNNSTETDATVLWKYENVGKIGIGDSKDVLPPAVNGKTNLKFYELEVEAEKDYLISAHTKEKSFSDWNTKNYNYCETVLVFNDGTIGNYMGSYYDSEEQKNLTYGEEYYDADGVYWIRFKFPKEPPKNIQKIYILGYQTSAYYTTEVKVEEIVHPKALKTNVEVTIPGGSSEEEYNVWYEITPTEDTYYYFESNDLDVAEVGIWNEEAQMYYTEFPDFFYKFREGASDYLDVQKCYKLEANVRYGIRIYGAVPTSGTSFVWKTTSEGYAPGKLNLGEEKSITSTAIYEISEETTTLGLLSYADLGFGDIGFFGNGSSLIGYEEGTSGNSNFKRNYVVLMPANKRLFVTAKALTNSKLTWNNANPTVLKDGHDEKITPTEDTIKLYEFTPEKLKSYQVLVQENVTEIVMVDDDGYLHFAGTEFTDENNDRWIQYSHEELEYIEKVYVIAKVQANSTGRVAFKKLTSAIDESQINDTLTVNQVVSIAGGENEINHTKEYTFIPETSGYYYLESGTLRDYSYAVYDELKGYYNYSPNLQVRCVLKENATTINDVVTSHYFEEGKKYLVYITGTVNANSSTTFIWKECTATDNAIEVSLNGEAIDVPANEISIFKLYSEETTVANIVVHETPALGVYGEKYVWLGDTYTSGDLQYQDILMPVGKGKTYYFVVKPTAQGTISFKQGKTKVIEPGDSFEYSLPEGTQSYVVCHEFVPVSGTTYEAHYGTGNKVLAIIGKDGNLNWITEGSITDSEGKKWTEIKALDNYEKIYLFTMIDTRGPQTVALKSDAPVDSDESQRFNVNYENLYDTNGDAIGYLNEATPIEYNTLETTALGEPTAVEGYDFVGWYSNEALSKKITSIAKGSTGDKTIYAKWKLHDYNINYELGEGKFSADANQPITFTMDKATVLVEPIRQGYALDYWYWMKEDSAGELYEKELQYNTVKENPEDPESPDKKVWYIPANIKEDVQIFAKWKFDTKFSLTINGEKDEDGNITITHPYNSATGEWDCLNSSFVIQSNTEGIVPELYYNEDVNLSVTATLMKLNEDGSVFETVASWGSYYDRYEDYEFYRVTDLIADDIKAPGKYRLEVCYTHPGQDMQYLEQEFIVNYAKREYPVNKEVSWSALSNVDSNRTYSMIASEIADKMQPDESVFITGLGERKLAFDTELVNVIFKDSKNRVVKNTAKVTSGTYTVVLEFAENDRFLTEATGTVNISYGTIASAGVQYLAAETLEDTDAEGRIPGSTIAFEIPKLDEKENPVVDDAGEPITINTTPYVNGVQIDPIVKVPWNTEAIPVAALKASLEANGYGGYTVSVGVSDASRKTFLTFREVTSAITEKVVAYVVTGNAAGKANLVFETTITDAEGNEVAVIPTTIKNFTVVNGGVDAVESITLDLYKTEEIVDKNLFKPKETDATGVKTYLIEKDEVARTYWLDVKALNYEGNSPENAKLSWKSSNSKLAAVKTAKDGTVTLTIPKNAQGVVDITVTAKDAAKNSQSIKFVIVDTSMRLDTTSLTMNSKIEGESAVAYLYPNVLASELDGIPLEDLFEDEGKIALYDRKKSGKTYIYEPSAVFDSEYNVKTGELLVTFNSEKYPAKAATHTVYVGILHEGDVVTGEDESKIVNPSEVYALKIKDTCALPKSPSLKVTKNYEAVYKEGWAELTLTLKSPVARIYDANVDDGSEEDNWTPAIQVKNTSLFEVVAWEDLSYGDGTTWKLKVRANDPSVLPAENQKSKVTKNVEFAIGYDGYRQDEDAIATTKANITAVRTLPTLYVYGEDAYAPVYYTDADYRYVDVVIPVTKELIEGITNDSSNDMEINPDSTVASIHLAEDKKLEIVLADAKPNSPSKFEVVDAEVRNYYFKVPGKKDSVEVEHAIAMTVMVNSSQTKNVNLQFNVRSTALEDGVTITTKALAIKPRTIKSESISLIEWSTGKAVKSLNFNSNYAGKESIEIEVMKPATLSGLSELNGFEYKSRILVEAADKNTQKMLQNNDLLVEADGYGDVFKVTSTSDSFKYKTAKLKITMVANEDTGNPLKTKSTTLTVNFKKALTPKITISNAKMIRGLNVYGKGFESTEYWGDWVETKVKYANMPVGAEVIDVRFADQADYRKYFDPYEHIEYKSVPEYLYIEARPEAKLSLGKDAIGLIYDVRTATGEVISIHATLNLTIADSFSLKTDVKSINLYNSAVGKDYGKYVTFYDIKGYAVEVLEIINEVELKNAGINFDLTATTEEELTKEHSKEVLGKDAVKFYVDGTLKRGIEKTYTVKAKVAVVDSAVKENETWTTTTATEKTLIFKIVLKK